MLAELCAYKQISVLFPGFNYAHTELRVGPFLALFANWADIECFDDFLHLHVTVTHSLVSLLLLFDCPKLSRRICLRGENAHFVSYAELTFTKLLDYFEVLRESVPLSYRSADNLIRVVLVEY